MTQPNEQLIEKDLEFCELWFGNVVEGEPICEDEIETVKDLISHIRALLEENKRLNKRLETMAEKAAESFEIAVEASSELEQVKAERDECKATEVRCGRLITKWKERVRQTDRQEIRAKRAEQEAESIRIELSAKDKVLEWAHRLINQNNISEVEGRTWLTEYCSILSQYKGEVTK